MTRLASDPALLSRYFQIQNNDSHNSRTQNRKGEINADDALPGAIADTRQRQAGRIDESTIEHYPSGSVVACVFLTANPSVYTPVHESIAHCWREKEMIQPHPLV